MFGLLIFSCMVGATFAADQDVSEVAFSAGLTKMLKLSHTERVIYDRIYTNIGNAYNANTGTFTCPSPGIYVFQFHSLAHQDKATWVELYHNYRYIASTFSHSENDYGSSGNTVILHLSHGDQVYIQAVDPSNGYETDLYGQSDEVYCTFSGYMISPIYEDAPASVG